MRRGKVLLLAVMAILIAVPVFAEPSNYVQLKLGVYMPQSNDLDDLEIDDEFYGEVGFGHYFNKNIALDFGIGYTKPGKSVSSGGNSASIDVTIIPVTLGMKYCIPLEGFEPFITAGLGMYFVDLDASVNIPGYLVGSSSESDTALGYYIGAGGNINVSSNMFLGIEGKYFWAEPSFDGVDLQIDGFNLTANIGYRF